ncbi:MAG: transcription antitermination factor NusB [Rhodocyclaceae bacterium]|nr:transcription antitermination factor NusB [Rhodocyclaceae bacterium]
MSDKPRKGPLSPRHRAREFVLQGLYQHLVGGQDEAAIIVQAESAAGFDKAHRELYDALLAGVLNDLPALQALLAPHVARPWAEVSPIERAILLMAACELKEHLETPYRVVLNEAIELAKSYGGTDGHKFVNGVLDKLGPQLRPHETLTK